MMTDEQIASAKIQLETLKKKIDAKSLLLAEVKEDLQSLQIRYASIESKILDATVMLEFKAYKLAKENASPTLSLEKFNGLVKAEVERMQLKAATQKKRGRPAKTNI